MNRFRLVALWGVHLSLLIVAAGAMLTWAMGRNGSVSLAAGETAVRYTVDEMMVEHLPKPVTLDTFYVEYYPGGAVPCDYVSRIVAGTDTFRLSMNQVADIDGWRFTQSQFTTHGTVEFGVSYDPMGRATVYAGFLLFALSGLLLIVIPKRSRIKKVLAGLLILFSWNAAGAESVRGISEAQADSLARVQVVYNGRVVTFDTFARDMLTQVSGSSSYRGMSAVQAVGSMIFYPEDWSRQPLLKVKGDWLRDKFGGSRVALDDLFEANGVFRLTSLYQAASPKHQAQLTELDGRVGLLLQLYSGSLVSAPEAGEALLSPVRVKVELFYNRVPLALGACVMFVVAAVAGFMRRGSRWLLCGAVALAVSDYTLRWWIAGHVPLGSMPDTLRLAVIVTGLCIIFMRRSWPLFMPVASLACAAMCGTAVIMGKSPAVATLMPVLRSPWLGIHVSVVMVSYSLLLITFLSSVCALARPSLRAPVMRFEHTVLPVAVWLLGLGIATGAVWAEMSWGRYWAWDPKEIWALVTFAVYSIGLHPRLIRRSESWHVYIVAAFAAVLMTYVGVNYMPSLHAYA